MTLDYLYDEAQDIFTIEGVRYSGELLRTGMQTRPNTLLRIVKRGKSHADWNKQEELKKWQRQRKDELRVRSGLCP